LTLGGCGFFFGWAQLNVPLGSYGVISSKTHGVDAKLVQSGEFRWVWYKLIPTNVQIAVFRIDPQRFTLDIKNSLPSGSAYASFAGLSSADFIWELKANVSYRLDPDKLIEVVSKNSITNQEGLEIHLKETGKKIEALFIRTLSSDETDNARLEKILAGNSDREFEKDVASHFPEIMEFSYTIETAQFPDFTLYRQVRILYEEFLVKQREVVAVSFGRSAESRIAAQLRFDELDRYGELLTKYPVLINYLALEMRGKTEPDD